MKPEDIKEQELSEEQLDEATGGHVDSSGQQNRNNPNQNRNNPNQNRNNPEQFRNNPQGSNAPGRG
jgi:hypothetical protein